MALLPYDVFAVLRISQPTEAYPGDAAINGYAHAARQFYFNNASHANTDNLGLIGRTRMELCDAGRWAAYFTTHLEQAPAPSASATDTFSTHHTPPSTADSTTGSPNTIIRNNQYGGNTEQGGMAAGQPANHQHKRVLSLEVIESLSTPSRRRRNRPGAVQTPVLIGSASAVAQTGPTPSSVATHRHPFTLPPQENMSVQDGMDLLECMRIFLAQNGYTPAGSHSPADGPDGGEHFEVYVTHLNHPTSIPAVLWAARQLQGKPSFFRVNRALVSIGGGFAGRLLRHWGQTNGLLRQDFDITNPAHQTVFADPGFADTFFFQYRHEFARFMRRIRLEDVEAQYINRFFEPQANPAALEGLITDSHGLAQGRGAGVGAPSRSGGSEAVGGSGGGLVGRVGSGQSRSGQASGVIGSGAGRDIDPIVVDDDDE